MQMFGFVCYHAHPQSNSFLAMCLRKNELLVHRAVYFLVVKSISLGLAASPPEVDLSQVQASAGRTPQAQVEPLTGSFSLEALSQLHSPAGRARHEHRAPLSLFS